MLDGFILRSDQQSSILCSDSRIPSASDTVGIYHTFSSLTCCYVVPKQFIIVNTIINCFGTT